MFNSASKKAAAPTPQTAPKPVTAPTAKNYVSAGTVIEGNIIATEDLHLDGIVKGDIKTTARLVLGKESTVEGNILAAEAEVAGKITGTVESKGLLAIKSTCRIDGDIITKSLNVESGSCFNGRCKVGAAAEEAAAAAGANRMAAPAVTVSAPVAAKPKM